ncbi:MAG: hypothetical protein H7Y27_15225, partial [Gemmatimonadaceae bacterium]|nr:hypothetical protein [Chitinophagaceae bacterium]
MKDEQFDELSQFSPDPFINLGIENEILRLRLSAELGGVYELTTELPPEVENHFLRSILAFERRFAEARRLKLYDLIGRPVFEPGVNLGEDAVKEALVRIKTILAGNDIVVEFIRPRDDR